MLVTLRGQRVQELLQLVIISFILMTLMFDSVVILEKLVTTHSCTLVRVTKIRMLCLLVTVPAVE